VEWEKKDCRQAKKNKVKWFFILFTTSMCSIFCRTDEDEINTDSTVTVDELHLFCKSYLHHKRTTFGFCRKHSYVNRNGAAAAYLSCTITEQTYFACQSIEVLYYVRKSSIVTIYRTTCTELYLTEHKR